MSRTRNMLAAGAISAVVALGASGAALATGGADGADDGDTSVTGTDAHRATRAALQITGGGHANSVERDSENGATWEIEVTKPDGNTVDVRLDEAYDLVVVEGDAADRLR